jgi:hypothetical protein
LQPLLLGCSDPPCPSTPATFQVVDNFPPSSAAGSALVQGGVRSIEESTPVAGVWNWITVKFRLAASLPPGAVIEISGNVCSFDCLFDTFVFLICKMFLSRAWPISDPIRHHLPLANRSRLAVSVPCRCELLCSRVWTVERRNWDLVPHSPLWRPSHCIKRHAGFLPPSQPSVVGSSEGSRRGRHQSPLHVDL